MNLEYKCVTSREIISAAIVSLVTRDCKSVLTKRKKQSAGQFCSKGNLGFGFQKLMEISGKYRTTAYTRLLSLLVSNKGYDLLVVSALKRPTFRTIDTMVSITVLVVS